MATRLLRHFNNPVVCEIGPDCFVDWDTGTLQSSVLSGGHVSLVWSMRDLGIEDGTRIRIYGTLYVSRLSSGVRFALTNNTLGELDTIIVTPEDGLVTFDFSFNVDYELPDYEGGRYYIELYSNAYFRRVEFGNIFIEGVNDPNTDPYSPIPPSDIGGGNQPYDPFGTDDIGYELLPEVSAVGTGFVSLWCPTEQQMLNLSAYMWNADILTLDFWKRLVADPLQLVYGLNIIPLNLRNMGIVGNTPDDVVVGAISTGIKMDYLTSQWVELDCGSIDIDESILGSYLDYDPFTKVEIYLPYIGYRPLRVDDIMPGTIQLKYRIDLLTGSCVAQIKATKSSLHDDTLDSVIYQFMGNCATQIPVTASQYADAVRSAITAAAAIGTVVALAGTGAAVGGAAGAELMPASDPVGLLSSPGMVPVDSELGMSMARYSQMTSASSASASVGSGNTLRNVAAMHSAASAGSNVMSIKPSIERSGAISGAAGLLSIQTPYLIFTRPRVAIPEYQNTFMGYPSFMTKTLSTLEGFTQIQAIHLEGIPCTATELAEIDALLKSGVIF